VLLPSLPHDAASVDYRHLFGRIRFGPDSSFPESLPPTKGAGYARKPGNRRSATLVRPSYVASARLCIHPGFVASPSAGMVDFLLGPSPSRVGGDIARSRTRPTIRYKGILNYIEC
jgi:hypothetical protein